MPRILKRDLRRAEDRARTRKWRLTDKSEARKGRLDHVIRARHLARRAVQLACEGDDAKASQFIARAWNAAHWPAVAHTRELTERHVGDQSRRIAQIQSAQEKGLTSDQIKACQRR